ncbi:MAG TPA: NAD-dependent epimerase/dehydratase family protein [Vicinamibacteria bacterium]|nr:NAD-dependent epimerase/dehydratase family protein [Vicinamibacteria bacterium]
MKVLLTGGTGFLGKSVARALCARDHQVRLLAREGSNLAGLPATEVVRGDVTDGEAVRRAAEGCQAVLHMAAMVKIWTPERDDFDRVNVAGLRHALSAAEAAGARLVYTSSFMALGPTGATPADESQVHPGHGFRNDYERTKALADVAAREAAAAGRDVVLLYPGVVYGPGDRTAGNLVVNMVADHLRGAFPGVIGPGDRLWSYAFVEDVAAGHVAALERGGRGERYILGGENVTMNGLFRLLAEVAEVPPPRRHIPYAAAGALGWLLYAWAELTGAPPLLTHEVVGVFREHWAYASAKAERELGYHVTPLAEGLRRTLGWLRADAA